MATVTDSDSTQSEFQTGTLTGVEADAGNYLRLADTDVLSFDGTDDYVEIPHQDYLAMGNPDNTGNPITIECWVYFDNTISGQFLMNKDDYNGTRDWNIAIYNDDELRWFLKDGGGSNQMEQNIDVTGFSGGWKHLSFAYDGSLTNAGMIILVDGATVPMFDNDRSSVSYIQHTTNPVNIGYVPGKNNSFSGGVSNVRVWNTARAQSEIANNMNKRLTGSEAGLVAYYKLDEGTGTTATDSAGTNDGAINGATWVANEPLYFGNPAEDNNRLSPQLDISEADEVESSSVSWTETLNGQSIIIETRVSTDSGSTWSAWAQATNGDSIPDLPNGTDVSTALVECRQSLSTDDISTTPELSSLTVEVVGTSGTAFFGDIASTMVSVASFQQTPEAGALVDTEQYTVSASGQVTPAGGGLSTDAGAQSISISQIAQTVAAGLSVAVESEQVSITGLATDTEAAVSVSIDSGGVAVSGVLPISSAGNSVHLGAASVVLSGVTPSIASGQSLDAGFSTASISGAGADSAAGQSLDSDHSTVSVTNAEGAINAGQSSALLAESLSFDGGQPYIVVVEVITPDNRIIRIPLDARTVAISDESRKVSISGESRIVKILS